MTPPAGETNVDLLLSFAARMGITAHRRDDHIMVELEGTNGRYRTTISVDMGRKAASLVGASPIHVLPERRDAAMELVTRVNPSLLLSRLELDLDEGSVTARSTMSIMDRSLSHTNLAHHLVDLTRAVDGLLPALTAVVLGDAPPEDALSLFGAPPTAEPSPGITRPPADTLPLDPLPLELAPDGLTKVDGTTLQSPPVDTDSGRTFDLDWIQRFPTVYKKWRHGWIQEDDRHVFVARLEAQTDTMRKRYEDLGTWEEVVQWVTELQPLLVAARQEIRELQTLSCAKCNGFCCARPMGEGHLLDPHDLALYAVARPDLTPYLNDGNHRGCIFLGEQGCRIPDDQRPKVCNMYACDMIPTANRTGPALERLEAHYQAAGWLLPHGSSVTYDDVVHLARSILGHEVTKRFPYRVAGHTTGANGALDVELRYHPEILSVMCHVTYPFTVPLASIDRIDAWIARTNDRLETSSFKRTGQGRTIQLRHLVPFGESTLEEARAATQLLQTIDLADKHLHELAKIAFGTRPQPPSAAKIPHNPHDSTDRALT